MIAIILVNWNGWQDTIDCVRSCLALEGVEARIVVCDNASADGSVEKIASWARGDLSVPADPDSPVPLSEELLPKGVAILDRAEAEAGEDGASAQLVIVRTGANLGFAGGNNVGLRWALKRGASHAWLLNNDTVVPPDSLAQMVGFMASHPDVGLCGSVMAVYGQPAVLQAYAGALDRTTFAARHLGEGMPSASPEQAMRADPPKNGEVLYPVGASMLASRAFLEQVGLMEEDYFLYYEEADWVLRAEGQFDVAIAPQSVVYHKVGASAGSLTEGVTAFSAGLLYRSRLKLAARFGPRGSRSLRLTIAKDFLRAIVRGRFGQAKGIFLAATGRVRVPGSS